MFCAVEGAGSVIKYLVRRRLLLKLNGLLAGLCLLRHLCVGNLLTRDGGLAGSDEELMLLFLCDIFRG